MSPVRIYSTLTGREDELVPLHPDGVLRMYVCGMTPKFHPHVGHARLFVAMDVIRRYLVWRGFKLKYVQNFTDVDDKIIQRAASENRESQATANAYIDSYFEVMDRLNVQRADDYPTVTTYMRPIVEFIGDLVEVGHAYPSELGDVWFDVGSFRDYGKLSRRDLNSQLVAARKELEPGKRDPRDFALWKRAKPGEPAWESPWGPGRPGWHIECSAMVRETLGDQIDIHGGGADLIFPHHENEIAQSESLTGKAPFARHWAHAGLVTLAGGDKMAHSAENFTTLAMILERYDPQEVRYFLLATHYRSSLTFALETDGLDGAWRVRGIEDARSALGRLRRALGDEALSADGPVDQDAVKAFTTAMDADFNTPDALGVIFDLAREINTGRVAGQDTDPKRRALVQLLDVLGLNLRAEVARNHQEVGPYVDLLVEVRRKLRDAKQWSLADEIRNALTDLGVTVNDGPGGTSTWSIER
ncbi:MAG: cysteine--tRNA ligase [Chloroflexi bacterium]|nr:cysteine--tRNA ligase [Chloroflexota bacterium]